MTVDGERAGSQTTAVIFMVGITILLAALVLLLFHIPAIGMIRPSLPVFEIRSVDHYDEITGKMNYDSRVRFINNGTLNYKNEKLMAYFYKSGTSWSCTVETLSGSAFIPSHHFGIQWMGGSGCSGTLFTPGEQVVIDFSDTTFRPGDIVRMDIRDCDSGSLISTHSFRA